MKKAVTILIGLLVLGGAFLAFIMWLSTQTS